MKKIIFTLLIVFVLLFGCKNMKKGKYHKKVNEKKTVSVLVDTLKPKNVESYIEFSSQPEGIVDITLTSQVSGTIKEIYKKMGDKLKKGDVIAEIDNDDIKIQLLQAKANFESAKENYKLALKQFKVNKDLYEKSKLISGAEFDNSASKLKSAEAAMNMANANFKKMQRMLNNSRFLAPEAGILNFLYIKKGQVIGAGKPVCSIVDPSKLIIKAGISQTDISDIEKGRKVIIEKNGTILNGKITALGIKPIDRANYPVEITVKNPENKILPGMIVKVKILKKVYKNVLTVPDVCIKEEFDRKYVYAVEKDKAKKVFIKTGMNIDGNVIVTSGLSEDDKIIYEGLENIRDNIDVKVLNGSK